MTRPSAGRSPHHRPDRPADTTTTRTGIGAALAASALILTSCADTADHPTAAAATTTPDTDERNLVESGYEGRFAVSATVLQSPGTGPQLCRAVAGSYPPQCGGPEIVGWDWDAVESESAEGTTWGQYHLVGTWDGQRFTLIEPAAPYDSGPATDHIPMDFTPPCPEPEGGWRAIDPDTATREALGKAFARAEQIPAYAGGWIHHLDPPDADLGERTLAGPEEPAVLTLRFTGDLDRHEQTIREVWGGPLCVTGAERTQAELDEIQRSLHDEVEGITDSAPDVLRNAVTVHVMVGTLEQQEELDQRYGEGAVLLYGWLRPID